jgi:Reverse transcriptase (RNA-dependent DNA polymerase)
LVAGGHLTPEPVESIYSGVVSLRALRLIIFIAELNKLQLWGADVRSAYLESTTKEKVYFIAGGEFGQLEANTLIVEKALYGLQSSGLRWHEKFADILRDIGFQQCRAESDIWMRKKENVYEYITVYVDDYV